MPLEQREQLAPRERLRPREQRAGRRVHPLVVDCDGSRGERETALVREPDHGGVDFQQGHDRAREHVQRRLEREAVGERARDLVLGVQALRLLALRRERRFELAAERRLALVQARVLHRDAELGGQGGEQGALAVGQWPRPRRVGSEQADRLVPDDERHGERGFDPGLARPVRAPRARRRSADGRSTSTTPPPSREPSVAASSASATASCGPSTPAAGGDREPSLLAEVDGDPARVEQRADALDRGVERVREREARDRLADDGEERPAALELADRLARAPRRAQRVRGAHREAGQPVELRRQRCTAAREPKLQACRAGARRAGRSRSGPRRGRPARRRSESLRRSLSQLGPARRPAPGCRTTRRRRAPPRATARAARPPHPPPARRAGRCARALPRRRARRPAPRRPDRAGRPPLPTRRRSSRAAARGASAPSRAAATSSASASKAGPRRASTSTPCASRKVDRHGTDRRVPARAGRATSCSAPSRDSTRIPSSSAAWAADTAQTARASKPSRAASQSAASSAPAPCADAATSSDRAGPRRCARGERSARAPERGERLGDAGARVHAQHVLLYRPKSRSTSFKIVTVSSTLTAINTRTTSQKRTPARRRALERSIRARAPGPFLEVGPVDRDRVEWRRVVACRRARCRLGHAESVVPAHAPA